MLKHGQFHSSCNPHRGWWWDCIFYRLKSNRHTGRVHILVFFSPMHQFSAAWPAPGCDSVVIFLILHTEMNWYNCDGSFHSLHTISWLQFGNGSKAFSEVNEWINQYEMCAAFLIVTSVQSTHLIACSQRWRHWSEMVLILSESCSRIQLNIVSVQCAPLCKTPTVNPEQPSWQFDLGIRLLNHKSQELRGHKKLTDVHLHLHLSYSHHQQYCAIMIRNS